MVGMVFDQINTQIVYLQLIKFVRTKIIVAFKNVKDLRTDFGKEDFDKQYLVLTLYLLSFVFTFRKKKKLICKSTMRMQSKQKKLKLPINPL